MSLHGIVGMYSRKMALEDIESVELIERLIRAIITIPKFNLNDDWGKLIKKLLYFISDDGG